MGATQPLPEALAGLRLPKCENSQPRRFSVHQMSKTAARNYGLKLKPRRRVRKGKQEKSGIEAIEIEPAEVDTQLDPDYHSPMDVDEHSLGPPLLSTTLIDAPCAEASPQEIPVPVSFPEWSPYCKNKLLVTNRFLYNARSRGRFPTDSSLYKILKEVLESENESGGVQVRNVILQVPVHRLPETADMTNLNLLQSFKTLAADGKFNQLDNILEHIVNFHLKIHNLYGLIKRCTYHWIEQSNTKVRVPVSNPKATSLDTSTYSQPSQAKKKRIQKKFLGDKLSSKVPRQAVVQGLSTILRISGCTKLLGSNSNRRQFLKFFDRLLMAGVVSNLKLNQLLSLLSSDKCPWLQDIRDPTLRTHIFAKTVCWLFSDYVLNVLKTGFHITETQDTRMELSFYFHETWTSVSHIVKDRLIRNGNLKNIHTLGSETLQPTASFRFLPKKDDLRPIAGIGLRRK